MKLHGGPGIAASTQQDLSVSRKNTAGRVPVIVVACPDCGSPVGDQCVSKTGKVGVHAHQSRIRLATRLYMEKRDVNTSPNP